MRVLALGAVLITRVTAASDDRSALAGAIALPWFLAYKFTNSLFLGLSIGSVFALYSPLPPSVFSAGGIGLALATLVIATQYHRLFNLLWFFRLSLLVELVVLAGVIAVLLYPVDQPLALFIYMGYQITFALGSYLVRCETLLITEERRLAQLDISKQAGYLGGMGLSWALYTLFDQHWGIAANIDQVVALHWPLLFVEIATVILLLLAFLPALYRAPT